MRFRRSATKSHTLAQFIELASNMILTCPVMVSFRHWRYGWKGTKLEDNCAVFVHTIIYTLTYFIIMDATSIIIFYT